MVLTRSFKALVQRRAATEPAFAEALLSEGVNALLAGDVGVGTSLLRDYIAATIGFEALRYLHIIVEPGRLPGDAISP